MSSPFFRRLILIPVVLFLLLEAILWIFVRLPAEPMLDIRLSNTDLPGLKEKVALHFNRRMVRFDGWTPGAKPAGTVRILCLGGSSTFAMLQNAEDTWWGQLRARLEKAGLPVQMAAWGQDRAGIVVSAAVARDLVDDLEPDIVIADFGFDDVVAQPVKYQYDPGKFAGMSQGKPDNGLKAVLMKVSQTCRFYRWWARKKQSGVLQNQHGHMNHYTDLFKEWREKVSQVQPTEGPARIDPDDPVREFMDGWKALHDICQQKGAALIMTGEPSLHDSVMNLTQQENLVALIPEEAAPNSKAIRPTPSWVEGEMNRFADSAEKYAAAEKHPWLNLNGRVPRSLDNFFNDSILTDAGAGVVAELLEPVVAPVVREKLGR